MDNKRELWATPVWEIDLGFDYEFNDALIADTESTNVNYPSGPHFNIWNHVGSESLNILRDKILSVAIEKTGLDLVHTRGWVNRITPGGQLTIHDHGGLLAVSYYMQAPENSGDLIIIDPRGCTNGWDNVSETVRSSKEAASQGQVASNRKSIRIKPKVGRMIMFPTYVLHAVDVNMSPHMRVGLACNLALKNS
jgi:uncharacterized protein (TIGR02466 family)